MAAPASSPTLAAIASEMSGLVFGMDVEASYLTSSWWYNLERGVSGGSIGVRVPFAAPGEAVEPIPISIEVSSEVSSFSPGRRMLLPVFGSALRAFLGTGVGWWSAAQGPPGGIRYAEYSAGLEGRLAVPFGPLEGEVACGLGPLLAVLSEHALEVERSRVLDRSARLALRIEPALRIGFVEHLPGGWERVTGLGASLAIDAFAWPFLPFAGSASAADRTFHVRIFAFGESRRDYSLP
jgi:hypothetical protein